MIDRTKPRVYVTGPTGFVGSRVVNNLISLNYPVVLLARDTKKTKSIFPSLDKSCIIEFDLEEENWPKCNANDVLLHIAWSDLERVTSHDHIERHLVNHYAFLSHVARHGVSKIIVTGTVFEYGRQYGPVYQSTPTNPNTAYGIAKDSLHRFLRSLQSDSKFDLVWLRLFYIYSVRRNSRGIFKALEEAVNKGERSFAMSSGDQLLDFLDVNVVSHEIVRSLDWPNGVYNVCSGQPQALESVIIKWLDLIQYSMTLEKGAHPQREFESVALWGGDPTIASDTNSYREPQG
jgi:nucleoside-diphosphate-sugar epimerase